ncbi:hypothetical protein D9M70_472480 [compost metagenome]
MLDESVEVRGQHRWHYVETVGGAAGEPVPDRIGNSLATVAVNPAVPAQTLPQLIAYARAHPGALTYSSSGNGTPGHLAGELLKRVANIDIRHVPYKGSAPAVADVVAGHVDIVFAPLSASYIKAGKLRALAYFGGARTQGLTNVPSIREAGVKGWEDALAGAFLPRSAG